MVILNLTVCLLGTLACLYGMFNSFEYIKESTSGVEKAIYRVEQALFILTLLLVNIFSNSI